ncbi:ABC transporter substrate-binding protein [Comamonadaceae bacterium OH2545_COT-014]|nr:ABC transporter substrate-binding protein [Comamonadaceae bacterium OH2545_COT-014]
MRPLAAALLGAALALPGTAAAKTLRVATQGDALSMDPHSLAEAVQLSFTGNIFEPLVTRDARLRLQPALATEWKLTAPNVWRFTLRRDVKFHDGTPFTADDVVFSILRAQGEGSDMRTQVASIRAVRKLDAHTVELETHAPNPILPDLITTVYMVSQSWAKANQAERPVDRRKGQENAASFKANGTGPFRLRERQPGVRTTLARHAGYWGQIDGNVTEVVFQPIGNDATRVAALVSGQVDLIDPVPLQDMPRLARQKTVKLLQMPESRVIFFGFDQKRDELLYSSVKGKNPFKDKRVRQAVYQAIDADALVDKVMRGAARPAGLMVAPGIRGYAASLDKRLPYDPDAARKLLAEAGYPQGFEVTLNCPNDRYVNDAEICQATVSYLARVGIKARLQAEPKALYFPKVLKRDTSFFMAGWSPAGYDAHNALFALMATPGSGGQGQWNLGAYSNPRLDELTHASQPELDAAKRNAMLQEALGIHQQDIGHIPLYQPNLAWGLRSNVNAAQRADNFMFFKWVTVN